MNDTISLDFIGAQLRSIQSEQRHLRMDNDLLRRDLALKATRDDLYNAIASVAGRMGTFETEIARRFEAFREEVNERFDSMSAKIEHHSAGIAALSSEVARLSSDVARLSGDVAQLTAAMGAGFDRLASELARLRG